MTYGLQKMHDPSNYARRKLEVYTPEKKWKGEKCVIREASTRIDHNCRVLDQFMIRINSAF